MQQKWWILAAVACGTFMATLDSSIVNIALPTLTKQLLVDVQQVKWVIIVYLLLINCFLLPFGRLSDQYGRKAVFQLGMLIFTLGSLFCSLSASLSWLLLARAMQALGAAMLMANGPAVITAAFPASERGAALGTMAMVVSGGLISGPSIGGFLISEFGWRSIFLVNLPIGLLGICLVFKYVPWDHGARAKAPFDWVGLFLQVLFVLLCVVLFEPPKLSVSGSVPLLLPRWGIGALTLCVLALFLKVESEAKAPLLDLSLMKDRTFWSANLASFLTFVAFSSVLILMPFFLEEVMHYPTRTSGVFMSAVPLTILVVAPISGRLSDRLGSRGLSAMGAAICALSLIFMAGAGGMGIHDQSSQVAIVIGLGAIGLAMGLFQSPNNNAIMGAVPISKLGVASAMIAMVRVLGMMIGTGLATSIFEWRRSISGDFVTSLHFSLYAAGIIALGAMSASLAKPKRARVSRTA